MGRVVEGGVKESGRWNGGGEEKVSDRVTAAVSACGMSQPV